MNADTEGDLNLDIRRVAADPHPDGTLAVEIDTSRGPIPAVFHPHEGSDGAVVWLSGARGGLDGPAGGLYAHLARDLAPRGVSSLRLDYRRPGELAECVLDTLAGVSMLKGLGAQRVALVGHSFGGAVVIAAGGLSPTVTAVAALSSQTYGATGAARLAPRPLLLIHGQDDTRLPPPPAPSRSTTGRPSPSSSASTPAPATPSSNAPPTSAPPSPNGCSPRWVPPLLPRRGDSCGRPSLPSVPSPLP